MSNWKIITPEATTNIVTNPSFETGTTGWIAGGSNVIAQDATEQRRGEYSCKCTYVNSSFLAGYALTVPNDGYWSFYIDVYVPNGFSSAGLNLVLTGFSGATGITSVPIDLSVVDEWQRVGTTINIDAGDLSGTFYITTSSAPSSVMYIYIDGLLGENKPYGTTYTDTIRGALDVEGGKLNDLSDDLHFTVSSEDGTGMPPVSNLSSPLALQPGALFEDQTIDARVMTLTGSIVGNSLEDFHSKRQALIAALNPKTVKVNERAKARIFRYVGADVEKEIRAVYDGGMERGLHQKEGFGMMDIPLRLKADDPMFYEIEDTEQLLTSNDTLAVRYLTSRGADGWSNFGVTSSAGEIWDIAEDNEYVYVCGNFGSINGISSTAFIARKK